MLSVSIAISIKQQFGVCPSVSLSHSLLMCNNDGIGVSQVRKQDHSDESLDNHQQKSSNTNLTNISTSAAAHRCVSLGLVFF